MPTQHILKVKLSAVFPLASLKPDDLQAAASATAKLSALLASEGFTDIETSETVATIRAKSTQSVAGGKTQPSGSQPAAEAKSPSAGKSGA